MGLAQANCGYMDAILDDLLFEFQQDLSKHKPKTLEQLRDYLDNQQFIEWVRMPRSWLVSTDF